MDWDKVKAEVAGLSEEQLKLLLQVAFRELPEDRQDFLVKLAGQMKRVNECDKKEGGVRRI